MKYAALALSMFAIGHSGANTAPLCERARLSIGNISVDLELITAVVIQLIVIVRLCVAG